jgi:hypothetical protein
MSHLHYFITDIMRLCRFLTTYTWAILQEIDYEAEPENYISLITGCDRIPDSYNVVRVHTNSDHKVMDRIIYCESLCAYALSTYSNALEKPTFLFWWN